MLKAFVIRDGAGGVLPRLACHLNPCRGAYGGDAARYVTVLDGVGALAGDDPELE